jgi:hypothetical protein
LAGVPIFERAFCGWAVFSPQRSANCFRPAAGTRDLWEFDKGGFLNISSFWSQQ